MTAEEIYHVGQAHGKLMGQLTDKKTELRLRERSCGTYHDVRKMTKLREEIASLLRRIERAERFMS